MTAVALAHQNLNDTELIWDIVAQLLMVFLQRVDFCEVAGSVEIMCVSIWLRKRKIDHVWYFRNTEWLLIFIIFVCILT